MDPLTELLKLYCDHSTQAIEAADGKLLLDAFGVTQPESLVAITGYLEAFALVSECSSIVDRLASKHPAPDEQVRESLRTLRRMVDDGELAKKVNAGCARPGRPPSRRSTTRGSRFSNGTTSSSPTPTATRQRSTDSSAT
jgi:hypothetical protein